ncbi:MAG: transporter substrate-binding domain-containing protein [Rickettsiaceae bacterium]|nr:transporter substrate-binding domain-containing protein [Rickettsiaceae bacterium]
MQNLLFSCRILLFLILSVGAFSNLYANNFILSRCSMKTENKDRESKFFIESGEQFAIYAISQDNKKNHEVETAPNLIDNNQNLPIISTQDVISTIEDSGNKKSWDNTFDNKNKTLKADWIELKPYQFISQVKYQEAIGGFDIDIIKKLSEYLGSTIIFSKQNSWEDIYKNIQNGSTDLIAGVVGTKEMEEFAYFSEAYRYEEANLFIKASEEKVISFADVEEFVAAARSLGFRVGIIKGATYNNDVLDYFINDSFNKDIVIKIDNESELLKNIINDRIDGFIIDKLLGSTIILENKLGGVIQSINLGIKTPIRIMFSKKNISQGLIAEVNESIEKIKKDGIFDQVSSKYLSRLILLQAINSKWLNYVTLIGVIAFALSGVAIGAKDNMSLFSTMVVGIMPAIPAGYIRDSIINESTNSLYFSTIYIIIAFVILILGVATVRLFDIYNRDADNEKIMKVFWTNFSTLSDVVGQSCFIITGATFAALNEYHPIIIWGPICAFLVSDLGTIFRDLLTKNKQITSLSGSLNPEIAILWGLIFSLFIKLSNNHFALYNIAYVVTFVVIGGISSRLLLIKYKISNITFKSAYINGEDLRNPL